MLVKTVCVISDLAASVCSFHPDVLTLFYANSSGRLISRSLRVNDALPPSPPDLPDSHSSTHLPLPNPFKVLKSLSTDHIPDTVKDAVVERIEIGDEVDNGEIGLPSPVIGLRAQGVADDVRLCAWSSMEMLVCGLEGSTFTGTDSQQVLPWQGITLERSSETRTVAIQDVKWIDHESISVLFSVCIPFLFHPIMLISCRIALNSIMSHRWQRRNKEVISSM